MNLQIMTERLLAKRWVAASWAPIPLRLIVGFGFPRDHSLGHLAMKPTSYTWPAWPPSLWVALGRGRSTGLSQTDCGDGQIPNRFVVFEPDQH
jgi:hypothetical protein